MEDRVEQSHQVMGLMHVRISGLKKWPRKAISISQYAKIKSYPQVRAATEKVAAVAKRNFTAKFNSKKRKADLKVERTNQRTTQLEDDNKGGDKVVYYEQDYMDTLTDIISAIG